MRQTDTSREQPDIETSSDGYARRFSGATGAWFLDVQARLALDLLQPWPGAAVLDVGGGHAQLTGPLVDHGHAVTVYSSTDGCRLRLQPWLDLGRVRFVAGDLLHAPWPDGSFDVVLAFRLLPHMRRWPVLVAELCRLARHAVVVDYPTRRSVNALADLGFGLKRGVEKDTRPFTVFRDREIVEAFAVVGYALSARRPQFFLPMALHRAMGVARLSRWIEGSAARLGLTPVLGSPVLARFERVADTRS